MKKFLSIILAIVMIVTTIPFAFAEGDGIPLTIDLSTATDKIYIGEGCNFYDEDGYIITGEKSDEVIYIYEDCEITLSNMSARRIDCTTGVDDITITLDGDNKLNCETYSSLISINVGTVTINGDDDDTLTGKSAVGLIHGGGRDVNFVVNGGKITVDTETDKNYSNIYCKNFVVNGGEINLSNNYGSVISTYYGKTALNNGTINVVSTSAEEYISAITSDIEMDEGTFLTVNATNNILYYSNKISAADKDGKNLYAFVRFDKESDFVPVGNIHDAIEGKSYVEIRIAEHEHDYVDGSCICSYNCTHGDFENDKCTECGIVCDHLCHKTGIMGFIWKIVQFFSKLFKLSPLCECGVAHY